MIRGFFFDLDGTLVENIEADYRAYHDAIQDVTGKDVSRAAFEAHLGDNSDHFLPLLIPGISAEDVAAIKKAKSAYYRQYAHLTTANDMLIGFLAEMAKVYQTALITTSKRANASAILDFHDIGKHFKHIIFGDDVQEMKPHPEAYLLALEKTGLKPQEVIAFEDSAVGLAAATGAGIEAVQVRTFR